MWNWISKTKTKFFLDNTLSPASAFLNTSCSFHQRLQEFVLYLCIYARKIKLQQDLPGITSHQLRVSGTDTKHNLLSLQLSASRWLFSSDHLLAPGGFPSHDCTESQLDFQLFVAQDIPGCFPLLTTRHYSSCTFLEHCSRRKSCKMWVQIPGLQQHRDSYERQYEVMQWWSTSTADLQLCLQRDAERIQVLGNKRSVMKWLHRLLSLVCFQFYIPAYQMHQGARNGKQWKIAVEGLKRVSRICRKLLHCPVAPSTATGKAGSVAERESSHQGERNLGRKEESWHRERAQLNYPHPTSNFCCQLWPESSPPAPGCHVHVLWGGFPCK